MKSGEGKSYWPIRILCHIINFFMYFSRKKACWVAGKKRFEIWFFTKNSLEFENKLDKTMNEKKEFVAACVSRGISLKKAKKAWDSLEGIKKYISENKNAIDAVCEMKYMSIKEKLRLREKAAEAGIEYTPAELDGLCDIVIHVMDSMHEEWKS